ncbi:TetR/AcrR family transcriptional regulator [Bifidobacterium mongoliense]|uniref:TetR/AcrR family transcriptional regulator n=1 Tax=Bifidobacterium mongoliense TaxID=518643 RepID=UPI0030EC1030
MTQHDSVQDMLSQTLQASDLSAKQKAVLRASLTLFSKQGYDRTSTQDIAALAGVSQGTVYKRYATKHDILMALITPFFSEIIPKIAIDFTHTIQERHFPDFGDYLTFVVSDRLEFVIANRELVRILIAELFNDQHEASAILAMMGRTAGKVSHDVTAVLAVYQRDGQLVDWPVPRIVRYVAAVVVSYALPRIVFDGHDGALDVERSTREIVEFLIRGLSPEDSPVLGAQG